MTSPSKPWEGNVLQNATSILRSTQTGVPIGGITGRTAPVLPPRPDGPYRPSSNYGMPYAGYGGSTFGGYGGYSSYGSLSSYGPSSYGSYGLPYSSSLYNSYGGYNNLGMYGGLSGGYNTTDDAERRFIQYAEESSRKTFANVESIVRAFSSIAMMLDNTFFAMTSSFRAVLSVAENFGRLRTTFGQIWYSVNIFRLFNWLYRKLLAFMGLKPRSSTSAAWHQAIKGTSNAIAGTPAPSGSSWPTLAFLGVLISAPYIISKFLPKYEDKSDMSSWKSPGVSAKAAFDFTATSPTEMSITTNDEVILAPTYIQDSMKLRNSGWVFAVSNNKSGIVPLNYVVLNKSNQMRIPPSRKSFDMEQNTTPIINNTHIPNQSSNSSVDLEAKESNGKSETKNHTKRVSFGENQIFENIDLDDIIRKAEDEAKQYKNSMSRKTEDNDDDSCKATKENSSS